MDFKDYYAIPGEKPLDRIVTDGGFCSIFRTIGFVGDSLSSGEFESVDKDMNVGYHDYYEYSWGQYIARAAGLTAHNFSQGGMTAKGLCTYFNESRDCWNEAEKCQAYVIALGVNDVINDGQPVGTTDDINLSDYTKNADTFAGWYGQVIQRYKKLQPKARIFLVTMPRCSNDSERNAKLKKECTDLLYKIAELFEFTYVLDFNKYAPVFDDEFNRNFFLSGHMNPAGYCLFGKMVASYIDYVIRNNPEDFMQVGFIGTPYYNIYTKY